MASAENAYRSELGWAWERARRVSSLIAICSLAGALRFGHAVLYYKCGLSLRFLVLCVDVCLRTRPWQRLIIPFLILGRVVYPGRLSGAILIGALELAVLLALIRLSFDPQAGEVMLARYLPAAFAKLAAGEMVIVMSALRSVFKGFRVRETEGFDYASSSAFWAIPIFVLVSGPPDLLLVHRLFNITNPLITCLLVGVEIWSVVWLYGIYVTMQERKHTLCDGKLTVYKGILKSVTIPLDCIESITALTDGSGCSRKNSTRITVPGSPCVVITLSSPACIKRLWGADELSRTIVVSITDPIPFIEQIQKPASA